MTSSHGFSHGLLSSRVGEVPGSSTKLARARRISDEDIKGLRIDEGLIETMIRDYHVLIDEKNRVIMHDCADWARCIPDRSFCKHLGKILLTMPKDHAASILRKLMAEREEWEFRPFVDSFLNNKKL